jgi:hypothetical protein
MSKVDETMALAHAYADAKLMRYGLLLSIENPPNPNAASVALRKAIEALAQPAGEAEPVAWRAVLDEKQRAQQLQTRLHFPLFQNYAACEGFIASEGDFYGWKYTLQKLYTTPQQSQPLTEEQIDAASPVHDTIAHGFKLGARFAEKHHNIKGVTE